MKKMLVATLAASALLAGCATPGYQPYGNYNGGPQYGPAPQYPAQVAGYPQYGPPPPPTVVASSGAPVPAPCQGEINVGTIIGGIAGALLGAQIGGGDGRTSAAALGAAAGALVGGSIGRDPNCH